MPIPEPLAAELQRRRETLADAQRVADEALRRVQFMEAELRGFEGALALFDTVTAGVQKPSILRLFGHLKANSDVEAEEIGDDGRVRRVKGRWSRLMAEAAKVYPQGWSFGDWERAAERLGMPLNRNTLRSQMSTYTNWGLVERLWDGHYRITAKGASAAGARLALPKSEANAVYDANDAADDARDAEADNMRGDDEVPDDI